MNTLTALLASLSLTPALLAGPLNPPPGPIAPTAKPLADVEPRTAINATNTPGDADSLFKITQPGSYYLVGNITGVAGRFGIEIAAGGVTLDLAGFELVGVAGASNGVITTVPSLKNIEIRNGTIRAWGGNGVDLSSSTAISPVFRDLRVADNGINGIMAVNGAVITSCTLVNNGNNGILVNDAAIVTNCSAHDNGGDGIDVASASVLTGCVSFQNFSDGYEGGNALTLINCSAYHNGASGVDCISGATIAGCSMFGNTLHGIDVGGTGTISGNSCRGNDADGIRAGSGAIILANTCTGNGLGAAGGAGIHVTSADNRLEGNSCAGQDRGIDVDAGGNIIIRNTCSGNTINWEIAANNYYGPIINRASIATAAVSGDAASETLGSTHPNANFTY